MFYLVFTRNCHPHPRIHIPTCMKEQHKYGHFTNENDKSEMTVCSIAIYYKLFGQLFIFYSFDSFVIARSSFNRSNAILHSREHSIVLIKFYFGICVKKKVKILVNIYNDMNTFHYFGSNSILISARIFDDWIDEPN